MCLAQANVGVGLGLAQQYMQGRAGMEAWQTNADAAMEAARQNYEALGSQRRQLKRNATDEVGVRAAQAEREVSRINAIVSDSNLVGPTADMLKREVLFSRDTDLATIRDNLAGQLQQNDRTITAVRTETSAAIRSGRTPSVLGNVLGLAGQALNAKGPTLGSLASDWGWGGPSQLPPVENNY